MELLNVPYFWPLRSPYIGLTHRIHGAAIYGNMDPINIPQMLAYIPYMDPMGYGTKICPSGCSPAVELVL